VTDSGDKFPYNTKGFDSLDQNKYMFFRTPDDLMNGKCWNSSVQQNVTSGDQGLRSGVNLGVGVAI